VLKYVKGAIGETDVPDALPEFISQRRRWLNGSFFAAVYAVAHVGQIMRSGHSFSRKVALMIETVYNIINMVFSWFGIVSLHSSLDYLVTEKFQGNFYLFFVSFRVIHDWRRA
jgi:chitin synthase